MRRCTLVWPFRGSRELSPCEHLAVERWTAGIDVFWVCSAHMRAVNVTDSLVLFLPRRTVAA